MCARVYVYVCTASHILSMFLEFPVKAVVDWPEVQPDDKWAQWAPDEGACINITKNVSNVNGLLMVLYPGNQSF